jgi:hypothetical protein
MAHDSNGLTAQERTVVDASAILVVLPTNERLSSRA